MEVALPCKNRLALEHLTKDATGTPHVDGWSVAAQLQEQLRRAVPSSDNEGCVISFRLAIALASLRHGLIVMAGETEVCNLQASTVVDEEVCGLHVAVENVVVMQVAEALEQLQHVALDLGLREFDVGIVEQTGEIVVHVGHDHVEYGTLPALCLWALDRHLLELQDVVVGKHLEQLDLAQGGDGKAVLLIVGEDLLHSEDAGGADVSGLVNLSKGALAQLLQQLVLADLGAALEAALQARGGGCSDLGGHSGDRWGTRRGWLLGQWGWFVAKQVEFESWLWICHESEWGLAWREGRLLWSAHHSMAIVSGERCRAGVVADVDVRDDGRGRRDL